MWIWTWILRIGMVDNVEYISVDSVLDESMRMKRAVNSFNFVASVDADKALDSASI